LNYKIYNIKLIFKFYNSKAIFLNFYKKYGRCRDLHLILISLKIYDFSLKIYKCRKKYGGAGTKHPNLVRFLFNWAYNWVPHLPIKVNSRLLLPAPPRFSTCISTILNIPTLTLTYNFKRGYRISGSSNIFRIHECGIN